MEEQIIYEYILEETEGQNITMPIGSKILTVQNQDGKLCMWVLVDPKASTEVRFFEIFGTGNPVLSDMGTSREYIATVQMPQGLVWHIFEYTGI